MGNVNDGNGNKCPICNTENIDIYSSDVMSWYRCYTCPECGVFFAPVPWYGADNILYDESFKGKLKIYLFYHKSEMRPFICSNEKYERLDKSGFVKVYHLSPSMVNSWYPQNFAEKVDLILQKMADLSEYDGAYIPTKDFIDKLFFCSQKHAPGVKEGCDENVQLKYMDDFLSQNGYVNSLGEGIYQLTPKALERIYELRRNQSNNKDVFVSMAFNDETAETREAIRDAIVKSGYSPKFIDEIIHNRQIVPEMFRLIRECRFLILDISDPNYGAYYEAGYALGRGKEVIICCSKEAFNKTLPEEEKKYEKYLKPHFDIAQKQILIWDDHCDLTHKLSEWIKAIVG